MIAKPNPNYKPDEGSPRARGPQYIQVGKGDTFEMVIKTPLEGGISDSDLQNQIDAARAEYKAAKSYSDALEEIYAAELAKCGETYEQRSTLAAPDQDVIFTYLQTSERDAPLEVLTINDYTFVTNPNVAVSMSSSSAERRNPEAFVQITAMAYNREYSLDIKEMELRLPASHEPQISPWLVTHNSQVMTLAAPSAATIPLL